MRGHQTACRRRHSPPNRILTFISDDVAALPLVSRTGEPAAAQVPGSSEAVRPPDTSSVYEAIERLAALRAKGILTEEEYASKKAELLSRI